MRTFDRLTQVEAEEIKCEGDTYYKSINYEDGSYEEFFYCEFSNATTIDSPDTTTISNDALVYDLYLNENENIHYLPVKVDESFPELVYYFAFSSAIKHITKHNFKGLVKLLYLDLGDNLIEKISAGVFNDLTNLSYLFLGEWNLSFLKFSKIIYEFFKLLLNFILTDLNRIKFIAPGVFVNLKEIYEISLYTNECIDEYFDIDEETLENFEITVQDNCWPKI